MVNFLFFSWKSQIIDKSFAGSKAEIYLRTEIKLCKCKLNVCLKFRLKLIFEKKLHEIKKYKYYKKIMQT